MEQLKKEINNLGLGDSVVFERELLKKVKTYLNGKTDFIIIAAPNGKYKVFRMVLN